MNKQEAQQSLKRISTEVQNLSPSTLVTLYEMDVSDIAVDFTVNRNTTHDYSIPFRFHNMNNLKGQAIKFQGEQYYSTPIITDGFEMSSAGNLPQPKLTITTQEGMEDYSAGALMNLKHAFREVNNLVGAKVTRIRTFVKFLDKSDNDNAPHFGSEEDPNAEFPRDIYYIDRKSAENKRSIQFELSSVLDLQDLKLPGRLVMAGRCPWSYRGEGCCYEYKAYAGGPTEGDDQDEFFGTSKHLADFAPPVADFSDNFISGEIPTYNENNLGRTTGQNSFSGEYNKIYQYPVGSVVFIEKNDLKYYFVSKGDSQDNGIDYAPKYHSPPNERYWMADQCSKTIDGCKLRWGKNGAAKSCSNNTCSATNYTSDLLPFGGYPGTNTRVSTQ